MGNIGGLNFYDFLTFPKTEKIMTGNILNTKGENVPYFLELGFSRESLEDCEKWKNFINEIIVEYTEKNHDEKDYEKTLQDKIMMDDIKWNWPKKAFYYNTSKYNWFFLKTEDGTTQAVCLTSHPMKSILDESNIFFIEYIASAPRNRISLLYKREFEGIGTEIIKQVQIYFKKTYHYKYGFSLRSLPQARGFYEKIGMVYFEEHNKDGLFFYEIDKDKVELLLGETNVGN